MMTSKKSHYRLCSLLFVTGSEYEKNLSTLLKLIQKTPNHSLIVAPEVCLTGFDYDNMSAMLTFAKRATEALLKHSFEKIIICTMLEEIDGKVYNLAKVFHNGELVFQRAKARLFRFGGEHNYMEEGSDKDFKIVEIEGIKIAIFICFELRFKELWKRAEGADVIVTPSWWGKARSEHFKVITQTLAIINQCYVVASDSGNEACTKISAIISPQGVVYRDDKLELLTQAYEPKEVALMRRYLDVGIAFENEN